MLSNELKRNCFENNFSTVLEIWYCNVDKVCKNRVCIDRVNNLKGVIKCWVCEPDGSYR